MSPKRDAVETSPRRNHPSIQKVVKDKGIPGYMKLPGKKVERVKYERKRDPKG